MSTGSSGRTSFAYHLKLQALARGPQIPHRLGHPLAPMAGPEALHETLDDLGLVCYRKGEYQRSADYQQRAIEAALKLPMNAATVGLYESRLALALHALDQRENAIAAMGRAEEALKEAYPEGSPAYSEAMNGLAAQYRTMGDNERAAKLL